MYDVIIIGCGITGASIAYELAKYNIKVAILEKENDVACKTTKANSGIIHAGYDPAENTKMARLNVLGARLTKELHEKLNFMYKQIGSLVVATKEDYEELNKLYQRGVQNGVLDLKILNKEELSKLEENLAVDIEYALYAPSAAIISPWEYCLALSQTAVYNGCQLFLSTSVIDIKKETNIFTVQTNQGIFKSNYIINASGVNADEIIKMIDLESTIKIEANKGEYFLLDKSQGSVVCHVIFQVPKVNGKGVVVTPTVHHNLIVGPNALKADKHDLSNSTDSLEFIKETSKDSVNGINFRENIRNYSGLRSISTDSNDFIIEESRIKGFINFVGIKSPGLSAAAAFGGEAKDILAKSGLTLVLKNNFVDIPLHTAFKYLSTKEQQEKIKNDSTYGQVICRCEMVTLGEIIAATKQIIAPKSIDGIKRRTNSGMGRCQGGFCGPQILDIMAKELNISPCEVLQDLDGSRIILGYTKAGEHFD